MSIINALDQLISILENAKSVPLTGNVIINKENIEEMVESIKRNYPKEIQQGQTILLERREIIETARGEANRILEETQVQQEELINKEEIVRLAKTKSEELRQSTKEESILLLQRLHKAFQAILKMHEEEQKKSKELIHKNYQEILNQMKAFKNEKIDLL